MDTDRDPLLRRPHNQQNSSIREQSLTAEAKSWIVMTSLLALGIGVCLQIHKAPDQPPNTKQLENVPPSFLRTDSLAYRQIYDMSCMVLSVGWILVTLIRYCCIHIHVTNDNYERQGSGRKMRIGNYLVYGLSFFAMGVTFLATIETMTFYSYDCFAWTGKAYVLVKITFVLSQVIFIFFSRYRRILSKTFINNVFLFLTIIANIILYLRDLSQDALNSEAQSFESYIIEQRKHTCVCSQAVNLTAENKTLNCHIGNNTDFLVLYNGSRKFLFPFCLAFCVTASALLSELWTEEGSNNKCQHHLSHQHQPSTYQQASREDQNHIQQVEEGCQSEEDQHTQQLQPQQNYPTMHNVNHKRQTLENPVSLGSVTSSCLLGLLLLSTFVFVLIYQYYNDKDKSEHAQITFSIIISSVMIFVCLIGLISLHWNKPIDGGISLDEFLVFFSLFGVYTINLMYTTAAIIVLYKSKVSLESQYEAKGQIAMSVLNSTQSALQAAFISTALHRKSRYIRVANTTNLTIILIFCNIGLWLLDAIAFETVVFGEEGDYAYEANGKHMKVYQPQSSLLIRAIFYQLVIFFRIHCVFVLYRIFNHHRTATLTDNDTSQNQ